MMILASSIVIEWSQVSALCAVLALVGGGAGVAYLRLFIRNELLTVERSILGQVAASYEKSKVAQLKATQINSQIATIKDDMKDMKSDLKDMKRDR